jgi:hypothetical protein
MTIPTKLETSDLETLEPDLNNLDLNRPKSQNLPTLVATTQSSDNIKPHEEGRSRIS